MNTFSLSEDTPFLALRRTWQPVINAADLSRGAVAGATLLGESLVLARFDDGGLLAARSACPHKGYDLSRSRICEGRLQCGYHGWRFNAEGECLDIPSLIDPPADKLGLWGVLVSPDDTLANTFQKTFRRWLLSSLPADDQRHE